MKRTYPLNTVRAPAVTTSEPPGRTTIGFILVGCALMFVVLQIGTTWLTGRFDMTWSALIATSTMLGLALLLEKLFFKRGLWPALRATMNTFTSSRQTTTPPASTRRISRIVRWSGRALLGLLALVGGLALAGAIYQAIATARDQRAYPPPGQLLDVGGYKLHIFCMGQGSPTVILDHVGAGNSAQWGFVQPEIAKTTRVCAYDRAGFGWSDPGPAPRDARLNMQELHALLTSAHIAPPYVLVGHSFGGDVARLYVAHYRDQLAGMVLVDPGKLFDTPGVPAEINAAWQAEDQTIMRLAPILSRLGVMRLAAIAGMAPGHGDLPAPSGAAFDALNLSTAFWDTLSTQNQAMPATSAEVLGASDDYGTLPLIVLSADQPTDRSRQIWAGLNTELATHSTIGVHHVVAGASHMALALDSAHAQATIAAIQQVVHAAQTAMSIQP